MNRFSPSDAALEGFRITRENPRAFAWWVGVSFLVSVAGVFITVLMPENVRNAMETLAAEETPDLATFGVALLNLLPLLVFGLAFLSMMAAAIYRLIFRHSDDRYGYLRLGWDELRLMTVIIIFVLIATFTTAALTLVAAVIGAVVSIASKDAAVWFIVLAEIIVVPCVLFGVFVWAMMALPATFAERRIQIRSALSLMRPVFWRLAGAYLIAFACMTVIGALALILFSAVAGIVVLLNGGQLSDLSSIIRPDEITFNAYLRPGVIAYMIVGTVFNTLFNATIAAPGAIVYRHQHDDPDSLSLHGYTG
jgi:hypothetical protein